MQLLVLFVMAFVQVLAQALTLGIFVRVLLSWVPVRLPWGLGDFVWSITEPILAPIRRALPFMGGIDFSPLVALFAIQGIATLLLKLLPQPF